MKTRLPTVASIGQPNTGKSPLFNRILGHRKAIEHHTPGVTRDHFETLVSQQIQDILQRAHLFIFLTDGRSGPTAIDSYVADLLRKSKKPFLLVVNKIDTPNKEDLIHQFYSLGIGNPVPISASHGLGIGHLLDTVCEQLEALGHLGIRALGNSEKPEGVEGPATSNQQLTTIDQQPVTIKVTILGRPNVGKSTLLNALVGKERSIVSDIAGTTRDALDTDHTYNDQHYLFIDTAGLRHKARVTDDVEYYSTTRSLDSLKQVDVALLVLDAQATITEQDQRIAGHIEKSGCGCIILVNKWDAIPDKDEYTLSVFEHEISGRLKFMKDAPYLFISAKTKQRVTKIYDQIQAVYQNLSQKLSTSELNQCIGQAQQHKPAPSFKGKRLKIYYTVQTGNKPFIITCFVNNPLLVHFSYKRYLENRLREWFQLEGVMVRVVFRKKS